jgi:ATP synthase protein I
VDDSEKRTKRSSGREFSRQVAGKERRKSRFRKKGAQDVWFGLGMFGLVGWSVAIPMVVGIFIGVWIDLERPSAYSWTLMLLVIGLLAGCANAWFWIQRERRAISRGREDDDGD